MRSGIDFFVKEYHQETVELMKILTAIPAPTGQEWRKAEYILKWLHGIGAKSAYIDKAGNVIYLYGPKKNLTVCMAHMDTVFPDAEPLSVREDGGRLYAPGIMDDNANLANLLMCIKYLLSRESRKEEECHSGILFVADTSEEGLGNLKGSREILRTFVHDIARFIGFDSTMDYLICRGIGSLRYRISVITEGGHSFGDFGKANAIHWISQIVCRLYEQEVSLGIGTTYNVGTIEGGTTVNSIASYAAVLYEIRSGNSQEMEKIRQQVSKILDEVEAQGITVQVEKIGERPCGSDAGRSSQKQLEEVCRTILENYSGAEVRTGEGSTDANVFLAAGIPSVVMGTAVGGNMHSRNEWMLKESLRKGQLAGLHVILHFLDDSMYEKKEFGL